MARLGKLIDVRHSWSEGSALINGDFLSSVLCGGILSFLKEAVSRNL